MNKADLHLLSPAGFRAAGVYAGIKTKHAPDVGLLIADRSATAAAVFTTNKVFAAPVKVGREHVASGKLRGVVVNAGNANACTGKQGERDALRMCEGSGMIGPRMTLEGAAEPGASGFVTNGKRSATHARRRFARAHAASKV